MICDNDCRTISAPCCFHEISIGERGTLHASDNLRHGIDGIENSVEEMRAEILRLTGILQQIRDLFRFQPSSSQRFRRSLRKILFEGGFTWDSCAPGPLMH